MPLSDGFRFFPGGSTLLKMDTEKPHPEPDQTHPPKASCSIVRLPGSLTQPVEQPDLGKLDGDEFIPQYKDSHRHLLPPTKVSLLRRRF
jgi:hypothetical protein